MFTKGYKKLTKWGEYVTELAWRQGRIKRITDKREKIYNGNQNIRNRKLPCGEEVSNDELAKYVDTSDEWISSRTGIKEQKNSC